MMGRYIPGQTNVDPQSTVARGQREFIIMRKIISGVSKHLMRHAHMSDRRCA